MANGNLTMGDLSVGISSDGMTEYIASLRANLITETGRLIDDISDIEAEIDAGWQGVTKDRFIQAFSAAREKVKADLQAEYNNLYLRLQELQTAYFKADENIMDEI